MNAIVFLYCIATACSTAFVVFFTTKRLLYSKMLLCIKHNNSKIKALETEIDSLLSNKHKAMQEKEARFEKELQEREKEFEISLHNQKEQERIITRTKDELVRQKEKQEKLIEQCREERANLAQLLEGYAALTKTEARDIVLQNLEKEMAQERAKLIRRYELEAKQDAQKKANYIIAQATTRFAGKFVNEELTCVITLQNDEMKGKIIGKDGRNIKAFEQISGVTIIIGDSPNEIILSSFNLYRRTIAMRTLEILIEDGRIQPSRIEEVYEKVQTEMEEELYEEGDRVVLELGIGEVNPALKKLIGRLKYRASFGQNALEHSLEVAYFAGIIAAELGGDSVLARRAGLLHDIGKALTHEYGGDHVTLGVIECSRYNENPVVLNAIRAHHGHEDSQSIECSAVCTADVLSAARPGARREVLENYLKRVQNLEKIAMEKFGVKQAYAVYAGREVRVIVRADLVSDSESILLAKEIAEDIKGQLQYPGAIKVHVIREMRAVEYA